MDTELYEGLFTNGVQVVEFADTALKPFNLYLMDQSAFTHRYMPNASVDLSLVRGTEHGDYFDSTWRELLGDPAKNISPRPISRSLLLRGKWLTSCCHRKSL